MPFQCSICGEESTRICARCTKDECDNHLCEKCLKCSDCCECEVRLSQNAPESVRSALHGDAAVEPREPAPPVHDPLPSHEPEPIPVQEPVPPQEPAPLPEQDPPEFMVPAEPQLEMPSQAGVDAPPPIPESEP